MNCKPLLFATLLFVTPAVTLAGGSGNFVPLVGVPGLSGGDAGFGTYINALYGLAISLAAIIAVIKIIIAGAKYMLSDIVTHKSDAKEDIKNSLIGLLIIIGAVIILSTINTDITENAINADALTIDNTIEQTTGALSNYSDFCRLGAENNTSCGRIDCVDIVAPAIMGRATDTRTCEQICEQVFNGRVDYTLGNECFYLQSNADACNPQADRACCTSVHGGTWTNNACGGLENALENRIASCYEITGTGVTGTWDEAAGTCRPTRCDRNTDQRCCEITYQGTWSNGSCAIDAVGEAITAEAACRNQPNRVWDIDNQRCMNTSQYNFAAVPNPDLLPDNPQLEDYRMACGTLDGAWQYDPVSRQCISYNTTN